MVNILLIATTPLTKDGLTKIEMDVIRYNKDFQWTVACSDGFDNEFGRYFKSQDVRCINLPSKRKVVRYVKSIRNLIKTGNYDCVYIHGNSAMMLLQVLPSKLGGAKRIITHCHNTKSDFPLMQYLAKPMFNSLVDVKLACSDSAAKWAYFGKNIKVVVNGIEPDKFNFNSNVREDVRESLKWKENYVIGHVGRFNKQKNHKRLIDIFAKCYQRDRTCRLLLIGEGELKDDIEKYVKLKDLSKIVFFAGTTNHIERYYNAMDAFLMPSIFEGFCIVAVEAQANGLHVVMSDCVPPEAYLAKKTISLSLNQTDDVWAEAVLEGKNKDRNVCNYVKGTELDKDVMMEDIRRILFK